MSSDGAVGICYEHSPAEAIGILNLFDEFFSSSQNGIEAGKEDVEGEADLKQPVAPPIRLEWVISPEMKRCISDAAVTIDK